MKPLPVFKFVPVAREILSSLLASSPIRIDPLLFIMESDAVRVGFVVVVFASVNVVTPDPN